MLIRVSTVLTLKTICNWPSTRTMRKKNTYGKINRVMDTPEAKIYVWKFCKLFKFFGSYSLAAGEAKLCIFFMYVASWLRQAARMFTHCCCIRGQNIDITYKLHFTYKDANCLISMFKPCSCSYLNLLHCFTCRTFFH